MDMMDGTGGGGSLLGVLLVLLWVVSAAGMFAAGWFVARRGLGPAPDDSVAVLRRRLAAGEIDDEQYFRLRSAIESR